MTRRPIFLRPITPGLTDEEEAAEVAEIVRLVEAALDALEDDHDESSAPRTDRNPSK